MPKAKNTATRKRYDTPLAVAGVVDELPPRQYSTTAGEILDKIIENGEKWTQIETGGRQTSSVQSMISTAATNRKVPNVRVAVRGEEVFARIEPAAAKK